MTAEELEKKYGIVPAPGRVAIKVKEPEEVSKHGLYIVRNAPEPVTHGEVIANCPTYYNGDVEMEPMWRVGEWVVFGRYTGTSVTLGRDHIIVLREKDVVCVIREEGLQETLAHIQVEGRD